MFFETGYILEFLSSVYSFPLNLYLFIWYITVFSLKPTHPNNLLRCKHMKFDFREKTNKLILKDSAETAKQTTVFIHHTYQSLLVIVWQTELWCW